MTGKRTDRLRLIFADFPRQLGLFPEQAAVIRQRASAKGRTIELELVHLITEGIASDAEFVVTDIRGESLHTSAHKCTQTQPAAPRCTGKYEKRGAA